jgi:hypothetical protein
VTSIARRIAQRACDQLARNDGWYAVAVFATILVPVVAILAYWSIVVA